MKTEDLLTAEQVAAHVCMSAYTIKKYRRMGIISAEPIYGNKMRFRLSKVRKQLDEAGRKQAASRFNGNIPTL